MPFHKKQLKIAGIALLLIASYFAGHFAAMQFAPREIDPGVLGSDESDSAAVSSAIAPAADNWGLSFQEEGQPPVANATFGELEKYDKICIPLISFSCLIALARTSSTLLNS